MALSSWKKADKAPGKLLSLPPMGVAAGEPGQPVTTLLCMLRNQLLHAASHPSRDSERLNSELPGRSALGDEAKARICFLPGSAVSISRHVFTDNAARQLVKRVADMCSLLKGDCVRQTERSGALPGQVCLPTPAHGILGTSPLPFPRGTSLSNHFFHSNSNPATM